MSAEAHDLGVGLAAGVEVRSALGSAHGQGGERILESLFESEELHDAEVHAGMEADTALIRADRAVTLDAEAAVDVDFSAVVHPGDTEHEHALGFHDAFQNLLIHQMGIGGYVGSHAFHHLAYGLMELFFTGVLGYDIGHDALDIILGKLVHKIHIF